MNIKYFKGIVLSVFLVVFLFSFSAQARRIRFDSISQQLIQNGEATIEADDGTMFNLELKEYAPDDRFPGDKYVVSVLTTDGVEIACTCFRVCDGCAYGYEDFRTYAPYYYFDHSDNGGKSYKDWFFMSSGRNSSPGIIVDKEYRLRYRGIGTALIRLGLEISQILGAKTFNAVKVLDVGFHRAIGYYMSPQTGIGGSVNMSFDLVGSSVVLPPIEITRRPE